MTDDRANRGEPDRSLVNLSEDHEVKYWSKKFAVSTDQLVEAVRIVGNSAAKVKEYLEKKK